MTCNNCGNEMNNGDRFCSRCGSACDASVTSVSLRTDPAAFLYSVTAQAPLMKDKLVAWWDSAFQAAEPTLRAVWEWIQKCPVSTDLLAAGLQILAVFLWFGEVVTTSVLGYSQDFSMHDMCNGAEFVSYSCAVLLMSGAVLSAFPGIRKFKKLNVPMIAVAWTFVWYLVGIFGAADQVDSFSRYGAEVTLTVGGWLLGITCVAAFVLLFLNGRQRRLNSTYTH